MVKKKRSPKPTASTVHERLALRLVRAQAARTPDEQKRDREEQLHTLRDRAAGSKLHGGGRRKKVSDEQLARDYAALKQQNPRWKGRAICAELAKSYHYRTWRTVYRRLARATNRNIGDH